ncbi:MAG: ElyC/SanA/YdcF family protein [Cellulophaga sp.]
MKKKIIYIIAILIFGLGLILFLCNYIINSYTINKTYSTTSQIPNTKVGIVLGTSSKLSNGYKNPYYTYRINATLELFHSGKIKFILVSGDNGSKYYNEPTQFKKDLMKGGVPESKIFLDFAGFRTLDSMVRAKEVFGQVHIIVISQKFHNQRAIYLASKKGLTAIGYNAKDVSGKEGLKVHFREYFARVKMFIDLLLNTQPKYLGQKIEIK